MAFVKALPHVFKTGQEKKCLQTPHTNYLFCSSLTREVELACLRDRAGSVFPKLGSGCGAGGKVGLVHELVKGQVRPTCGEVGWSFPPRVCLCCVLCFLWKR